MVEKTIAHRINADDIMWNAVVDVLEAGRVVARELNAGRTPLARDITELNRALAAFHPMWK